MTTAPAKPYDANNSVCAQCGAAFRCGAVGQDAKCWCFSLPHVVAVPSSADGPGAKPTQSCLCPACLTKAIAKPTTEGI